MKYTRAIQELYFLWKITSKFNYNKQNIFVFSIYRNKILKMYAYFIIQFYNTILVYYSRTITILLYY